MRELKPDQRVVPLLNDPQFAQMLRDAVGVRLVVSHRRWPRLRFLAGLYGDRVKRVFFVRERLFAVIHLSIDAEDVVGGAAIQAFVGNYRLLPVALVRQGGGVTAKQLIDDQLQ